ncbi:MAG TPA: hypothetical protein VFM09_01760 [Marmoricola sp.]|nr:hypothetical protein [Marmoricola sp.]
MALLLPKLAQLARLSHLGACQNARTAAGDLAERARERRDVEEFLARHAGAPRVPQQGGPAQSGHASQRTSPPPGAIA